MNYDVYQGEALIYSTDAPAHQVELREGETVAVHGSADIITPEDWAVLQADALAAANAPRWPVTAITKLAFRNRFTQPEKVALEIASMDNPAATMPVRQQAAAVRAYLADVAAATFIDLARADLRAGVQALETMTLLAAGRALVILDAPIQQEERPM